MDIGSLLSPGGEAVAGSSSSTSMAELNHGQTMSAKVSPPRNQMSINGARRRESYASYQRQTSPQLQNNLYPRSPEYTRPDPARREPSHLIEVQSFSSVLNESPRAGALELQYRQHNVPISDQRLIQQRSQHMQTPPPPAPPSQQQLHQQIPDHPYHQYHHQHHQQSNDSSSQSAIHSHSQASTPLAHSLVSQSHLGTASISRQEMSRPSPSSAPEPPSRTNSSRSSKLEAEEPEHSSNPRIQFKSSTDMTANLSAIDPLRGPPSLFFDEDQDNDDDLIGSEDNEASMDRTIPPALNEEQMERLAHLLEQFQTTTAPTTTIKGTSTEHITGTTIAVSPTYQEHVECISILRQGFRASKCDKDYEFRSMLMEERERMLQSYPLTEEMWQEWLEDMDINASEIGEKVALMEHWSNAVSQEMANVCLWKGYLRFVLRTWRQGYKNKLDNNDEECWSEVFTHELCARLLAQGVQQTMFSIPDSHHIWDRYRDFHLLDLASSNPHTSSKISFVHNAYITRMGVPHATIEDTWSAFSTFTSTYQPDQYEAIMSDANKTFQQSLTALRDREGFEHKLKSLKESHLDGPTWSEYLNWETTSTPKRPINIPLCLALFERCTLRYPMENRVWEEYMFFSLEKAGSDPRILSMLDRATSHCQWSGTLWAHRILALEKRFKSFEDIEQIKHKATESRLLTAPEEVFHVHLAFCGVLKRMGLSMGAANSDMEDFAELGIRSTLNEIGYMDKDYRITRLIITFLTERGHTVDAKEEWKNLAKEHCKEYEFWLRYYRWALVHTDYTTARSVLKEGAHHYKDMDWPEKIIDTYHQHAEDYGGAGDIEDVEVRCRRLRKRIEERRMAETYVLQEQQQQLQQQQQSLQDEKTTEVDPTTMTDADFANGKRRRSSFIEDDRPHKRTKSQDEDVQTNEAHAKQTIEETVQETEERLRQTLLDSIDKRNREKNTIIVKNLNSSIDELSIRKFFRECGTINSVRVLVEKDNKSATASIEFEKSEDVLTAQTRDGKSLEDRPIVIQVGLGTTIYITNFPPTADESWIKDILKDYGTIVDVRFPSLKYRHHARFCYVQFESAENAQKAIELDDRVVGKAANGSDMKLIVKISDPSKKQERTGAAYEGREIFVRNLDWKVKEVDLHRAFGDRWSVESVRIPTKINGQHSGYGFVVFKSKEHAEQALTMNDYELKGRPLKVVAADPKGTTKTTETGTTTIKASGLDERKQFEAISTPPAESQSHNFDAADTAKLKSSSEDIAAPSKDTIAAKTLYILNVADTVNDSRLRMLFGKYGPLRKVLLKLEHAGAMIEFEKVADAGNASLSLEGHEIDGKKLRFGSYKDLINNTEAVRAKVGENPFAKKKDKKTQDKDTKPTKLLIPTKVFRPAQTGRKARGGLGFKANTGTGTLFSKTLKSSDKAQVSEQSPDDVHDDLKRRKEEPKSNEQFRNMFIMGKHEDNPEES